MKAADEKIAYRLRPGTPDDGGFLWEMLREAVSWRTEDPGPTMEEVFSSVH